MSIVRIAAGLTGLNLLLLLGALTQARTVGAVTTPDVLRGRGFELVDQRDQVRVRLEVDLNGEVVLRLLDREGTARVKLRAAKDAAGLLLANDAAGLECTSSPRLPAAACGG